MRIKIGNTETGEGQWYIPLIVRITELDFDGVRPRILSIMYPGELVNLRDRGIGGKPPRFMTILAPEHMIPTPPNPPGINPLGEKP